MGRITSVPEHPVIDSNPSFSTTVSNFGLTDYLRITTYTAAALPFGYLAGGSAFARRGSMYTAGIIGLLGGVMFAYQSSAYRLMGFFPNEDDVAKHKN